MRTPPDRPTGHLDDFDKVDLAAPIGNIDCYGAQVNALTYNHAFELMKSWAEKRQSRYVCFAAVSTITYVHDSNIFHKAISNADLALADGMPVLWSIRRSGYPDQERLCGPDLIFWICEDAARNVIPVGFYGNTPGTLKKIKTHMTGLYPDLDIRYTYSPPFRELSEEEETRIIEDINSSGARFLLVGLGCPKQEIWMSRMRNRINAVMLGFGGAFELAANTQDLPPLWMQKSGLHWLYRIKDEPNRLLRRYFSQNSRFLLLVLRRFLGFNTKPK